MTETFEKHTEITKTDDERQIAVGVAMVPDSVDTQGDFERPKTIQQLSEGYMERLAGGSAGNGVMHATFPSTETISHVENRVLDEPEKIGGGEYPAGTWIVGKRIKDDSLWQLVENGTLTGFSIGGRITDSIEHIGSDIPDDVAVPDDMREASEGIGFPIREIKNGEIEEVSLVDTPAVPEAQIHTAKNDGVLKAPPELTAGVETATNYLTDERGHDEESAKELAEFLNRKNASGDTADSSGWVARAKSFFSHRGTGEQKEATHAMTDTEKQGRVLSDENIQRAMALHDISIALLDGTDVSQNRLRFTDSHASDFDLAEFASEQKAALSKAGTEIHKPSFSGTTTGDWDSPALNDFTSESWADLSADERSSIGDNFFVSASGFPADNFGDLALPVVEPSGELNLKGLVSADSYVGRTGGLSSEQESQIESWIDSLEQDNFDVESLADAQHTAGPTGRGSGRDAASESMNQDEMERIAELVAEKTSGDTDDAQTDDQEEEKADTDTDEEPPEWAKQLVEKTEENTDAIQQMTEARGESQQKDADGDAEKCMWVDSPFGDGGGA